MEHYVFVYGTLKKGFHNHRFVEHCQYVKAHAKDLEMYNGPYFPFVKKGIGIVFGELYTVDDYTLKILDKLEGHPNFYNREIIEVSTSSEIVKAWVYMNEKEALKYPKNELGIWKNSPE